MDNTSSSLQHVYPEDISVIYLIDIHDLDLETLELITVIFHNILRNEVH